MKQGEKTTKKMFHGLLLLLRISNIFFLVVSVTNICEYKEIIEKSSSDSRNIKKVKPTRQILVEKKSLTVCRTWKLD